MNTLHPLRVWLNAATTDEKKLLASRVGTSPAMLGLYARQDRHGRECSAERAGQIEAVTAEMHRASKGRLPKVMRTDLCQACLTCAYARKCLGSRATVSEFPIVDPSQLELDL